MRILLTGATGFLGSSLTTLFVKQGHNVILLKRSFSDTWRISSVIDKTLHYDIDRCSLEEPFKKHGKIDSIIHTATCYGRIGENISDIFEANTVIPLRLLEIASVYRTETFINTDTILNRDLNSYALSKKHFMDWGKVFAEAGKIRFVNIRLDHMYGPYDDDTKFVTYVIRSCLRNIPELKFTEGKQERDFIYIDDVVSAYAVLFRKAHQQENLYQQYDLASGKSVTIREFVEMVHRITGSTSDLRIGELPYRNNECMKPCTNIEPLRALGWSPIVGLVEGIKRTIDIEKAR